jgi:pyridoxine 5-phosphate synthase
MKNKIRLGVNIDHVATIRNARGGCHPDPVDAAIIAQNSGADGITIHLREDRRHIREGDLVRLKKEVNIPINLEMAATKEMLDIAIKTRPNAVCIVPEKRKEITTEGGLDVIKKAKILKPIIEELRRNGIKISLFIDPNNDQINKAAELNVDIVEIHTGEFCNKSNIKEEEIELNKIKNCINYANNLGLECHAGHGLNYEKTKKIISLNYIKELNIGHFIIGESIFYGLENVIKKMNKIISGNFDK